MRNDDWRDLDRRLVSRLPDALPTDVDAAWRRFRTRANAPGASRPARHLHRGWILAATAGAVLLAVWLTRPPATPGADIRTGPGERRTLRLPDGSTVVLAPGAHLRYALEADAPRGVQLEGQAWFEVVPAPERPFRVSTSGHEVRVLGTAFGVDAPGRGDSVTVAVLSGRVAFARTGGAPLELRAGQAALAVRGLAPRPLDSAAVAGQHAWLTGTLRYDGARLDAVVRDLERWFAVDIRLADPAVGDRRLTGVIGLDAPDRAFETVAAALDLQLERTGSTVRFSPRSGANR
ncbi:MAG: FecR family protein [Gemmatimonadales bacterium]